MHARQGTGVGAVERRVIGEPLWLRRSLIGVALLATTVLIVIPVVSVFWQALAAGWRVYLRNLWFDADTRHAIQLTLLVAPLAVVLNTLFGIATAWVVTRFRFPGKSLLVSLLDLPFAVSPVVAGLMLVLLFGRQGYLGPLLQTWGVKIIFAWPALVLATTFVTIPFVARELIPLMQSVGPDEELAALSLGASPWQMFRLVTLPNIRWALLFGIIQCNARAMGEFGAVSVVSGHIRGQTNTMPLHIEIVYNEYQFAAAFALASLLALLALVTLALKYLLEQRVRGQKRAADSRRS